MFTGILRFSYLHSFHVGIGGPCERRFTSTQLPIPAKPMSTRPRFAMANAEMASRERRRPCNSSSGRPRPFGTILLTWMLDSPFFCAQRRGVTAEELRRRRGPGHNAVSLVWSLIPGSALTSIRRPAGLDQGCLRDGNWGFTYHPCSPFLFYSIITRALLTANFPSLRDLPNIAIATTPAIMLLRTPTVSYFCVHFRQSPRG
ncbi:hypothetical protein B0H16DRAFT_51310 [Mycena metata]|uniref:Uncharacterized protein n=1 Tax=Mycena metata TaxID=1033252 RepID=A0AAD7N160_9AGAR|nr:hypothetical protein B0H16DRAFT_51310 [Mycena metata]